MENTTRFDRMIAIGELLIESQRLEASLGKNYSRCSTPKNLAVWQESRRWVAAGATDYAGAVREWREEIQVQIAEEASRSRRRPWASSCSPLHLLRKAG